MQKNPPKLLSSTFTPHSPPPFFSLPNPGPCSTRRPPCPGSEPPHPPSLLPRRRRRLGATAPSTLCPISGPLRRGREDRAEHAAAPRQRPCLQPYLLHLGLAPAAASYCSGRWPATPRELRWPWPHPAVQGLAAASAGLVAAAEEQGTAVRVRCCASLGPRQRAWIYGGTQRQARVHGGARSLRPRGSGPPQREELGIAAEDVRRRRRTTARIHGGGSSSGSRGRVLVRGDARSSRPWRHEELGTAVALDSSSARSSGSRRRGKSAAAHGDGLLSAAA